MAFPPDTQKIILKRQKKEKTPAELLFGSGKPIFETNSIYEKTSNLYGFE